MYAIEIKGGLLQDNSDGGPVTYYRWLDAFLVVAMLVLKGHRARVITYRAKVKE